MRAYIQMREDTRPYITESVWSSSAERVGNTLRTRGVHRAGNTTEEDGPTEVEAGKWTELPIFRLPVVDWREACPTGVCTTYEEKVDRGHGKETCRVPTGIHSRGEWTTVREPATQAVERPAHRGEWIAVEHHNLHPQRQVRAQRVRLRTVLGHIEAETEESVESDVLAGEVSKSGEVAKSGLQLPHCLIADDDGKTGVWTLRPALRGEVSYAVASSFCLTYTFTSEERAKPPALRVSALLASRRAVAEIAHVDVHTERVERTDHLVRYTLRAYARCMATHGDTTDDMAWIIAHSTYLDPKGGRWMLNSVALSGVLLDKTD